MTKTFDHYGINHMTVALGQEMSDGHGSAHPDADTLFLGGPSPTHAELNALGLHGQSKNYKIIYSEFDPMDVEAGPIGLRAVMTDGLSQTTILSEGRLWKRNHRSTSVLLFPGIRASLKLNAKGLILVREMRGWYHEEGYDLAREALLARAATKPGSVPVVAPVGTLVTVLDLARFSATFAAAA